jgi:outer membrane lipoprotein carrier protein
MNKIIAAVLFLALAAGASAQQKPAAGKKAAPQKKPAAAAPAKPAAVSTATAKAAQPAQPEDPAAAVLAGLKAWDEKLTSLKASFTQEVNFKEAGLKQNIEGTLAYVKPNLLRIEHEKPARQIVVTDKTDIWIYKPEDKQVVRTGWEAWRRTQDQNFSGILDFGNYSSLTARNETKVSGGAGAPWVVTFTPRSGAPYALKLTLSATDYFPLEAELQVESTVINTRLTSAEKNGQVDKAIFKFTPPKGVETLEFKN